MTDLFGLPAFSIVLFVCIGLLIGHLLWYRDTSADRKKLRESEDRYVKTRGAIRQRKQQFAQLQTLLTAKEAEIASKESEQQQLVDRNRQLLATIEEFRVVSADFEKDREATAVKHSEERKRSELLKNQLQEVLRKNTELENQLLSETDKQDQQNKEIAHLIESNKQLSTQVKQRDAKIIEREDQLAESANQIAGQQSRFDDLSKDIREKQSRVVDLGKQIEELLPLREQIAEKEDALALATEKVDQLLQVNHRHLAEIETLSTQNCHFQEQLSELATLQEVVTVKQTELVQLQQRLAASDSQRNELSNETSVLKENLRKAEEELAQQEVSAKQMERVAQELEEAKQTILEQRQSIELQTKQIERLNVKREEHEATRAQLESTNGKLKADIEKIESLITQLETDKNQLVDSNQQLETMNGTLKADIERIESLTTQLETDKNQLVDSNQQLETMNGRLKADIERIESLTKQLETDKNQLVDSNQQLETRNREFQRQLKTSGEERGLLIETRDQFKLNLSKANETIENEQATIVDLRKELESQQKKTATTARELDIAKQQKAEIETRVEDHKRAILQLQNQLKVAEQMGPVNESLEARVAELMNHIEVVNHELEDSLQANVKAGNRIRDLENQLHEHAEKIRDLRRTRVAAAGSIAEQPIERAA